MWFHPAVTLKIKTSLKTPVGTFILKRSVASRTGVLSLSQILIRNTIKLAIILLIFCFSIRLIKASCSPVYVLIHPFILNRIIGSKNVLDVLSSVKMFRHQKNTEE